MKKLVSLLLLILLLCGCSAGQKEAASSTPLTDYPATAFDITLSKCPQKVISLSPDVTDIITALGSEAQLVGVSDNCDTGKELGRFGTSAMPKIDAIKEAKPDLVFVSSYAHDADVEVLTDAGIKVAKVTSAGRYTALGSLYNDIALLMSGEITGVRNAANTFNKIDGDIKNVANNHAVSKKVAFFANDSQTVASGTTTADLIKLAGASKLIIGSDSEIIKAKPDLIICPVGTKDAFAKRFEGIEVKEFDAARFDRRGVKMVEAVTDFISVLEE